MALIKAELMGARTYLIHESERVLSREDVADLKCCLGTDNKEGVIDIIQRRFYEETDWLYRSLEHGFWARLWLHSPLTFLRELKMGLRRCNAIEELQNEWASNLYVGDRMPLGLYKVLDEADF